MQKKEKELTAAILCLAAATKKNYRDRKKIIELFKYFKEKI